MSKILGLYKKLHRTTQKVFKSDPYALGQAYNKVRHEFEKHKHVTNKTTIEELVKLGESADEVLRKKVIQLEEIGENRYKVNVNEDTEFGENTLYRDDITREQYRQRNRESRKKCSDSKIE